ncbi:Lovastatin diketide synthase, partial [Lachnellula willkommii]
MASLNLEPIAVIGFAVKFPQEASNAAAFWDLLLRGGSARTNVPADRYNAGSFHRADGIKAKTGTIKTTHGHFIAESLDRFDAPFFSITPHEAECMDPQQRWLLESTYHALENAGLTLDRVDGSSTSVHVGCFMNDHETMVYKDLEMPHTYQSTGNASALLANRISWFYNLHGPSISVNTACSGSLVALHLACQSLRTGETQMGLVCGSNLIFAPETTVGLSNLNLLSPHGKCYSFDERANGYARGEGIASLVIKPLSSAIRDGDNIRALIRGTGVNSDGRTPGIIKPSSDAQIALIRDTYKRFGVDPSLTRYFEAHATGTQVGDPLEAKTIATVFDHEQRGNSPLFVGALKTNIGHLEGASGIAGVIKTILVLENSLIPPNIWLDKVNPAIKEEWDLTFPRRVVPFPAEEIRRASVNSFGFGGTNAHVILDDAETFPNYQDFQGDWPLQPQNTSHQNNGLNPALKLLTWSAADENGITRLREAHNTHFINSSYAETRDREEEYLEKLAYTLCLRRTHLPWRTFSICGSSKDLLNLEFAAATRTNPKHQMCYIFSGQGAQWTSMGQGLLSYKCFRQSMEQSDAILRDMGCQFSILEKLYEQGGSHDSELDLPEFCQPISTAFQIALVELLASWGIEPSVVIGHSSGEIAAAFCAGFVTKNNALKLAFFRGVAVGAAYQINSRRGGMMTVRLDRESCEEMLSRHSKRPDLLQQPIQMVCYNSPQNVTLSGDSDEIQRLEPLLESKGIPARILNVKIAYHNTHHMQTAASIYRTFIDDLSSNTFDKEKLPTSKCSLVSTVHGKIFGPGSQSSEICVPNYWIKNLLSPVRFTDAVQKVVSLLNIKDALLETHFVEIGPHSTMKSALQETLPKQWSVDRCYSSMLSRQQPSMLTALTVAGRLHCLGYPVSLEAVNRLSLAKGRGKFLSDLPPYPFDHSKHRWLESRASKNYRLRSVSYHDFLGTPGRDWNPLQPQWNDRITLQEKSFIKDHKVSDKRSLSDLHFSLPTLFLILSNPPWQISGSYLYPAAGMLVMAIEAVRQLDNSNGQPSGYRFKDVVFSSSLVVPETNQGIETQFRLQQNESLSSLLETHYEFRLYMCDHGVWTQCCHGFIIVEYQKFDLDSSQRAIEKHKETWQMCRSSAAHKDFYANLRSSGLQYGPSFQIVDQICYGDGHTGIADIDIQRQLTLTPENTQSEYLIHPAALDCILQTAFLGISQGGNVAVPALVPTAIKELWISANVAQHSYGDSGVEVSAQSFLDEPRSHSVKYISLWKNDHQPFLLGDLTLRKFGGATPSSKMQKHQEGHVSLYQIEWKPHVDFLPKEFRFSSDQKHPQPEKIENVRLTEHVCLLAMSEILEAINAKEFSNSDRPVHLKKYLAWMQHESVLRKNSDSWADVIAKREEIPEFLERLLQKVKSLGPEGKVIVKLYKVLLQIFQGDVDPLQILFADDTLAQYYRLENPPPEVTSGIQKYVDYMTHSNPGLRVLEIGAGTGGMTKGILDIIGGSRSTPEGAADERARFSEYMFTDISPAFFKAATDQFGRNGFICKTLNIEKDSEGQGFSPGSYDLIIASNVLHATRCLSSTLSNTWKLLKPGGTDLIIDGVDKSTALSGAMISTAREHHSDEDENPSAIPSVTVLRTEASVLQQTLASSIKNMGIKSGAQVSIVDNSQETDGAVCVLLQTMDRFLFENPLQKEFRALKSTIRSAKNLLWVTQQRGSESDTCQQDAILGLSRSILSETEGLNIVILRLQHAASTERATQRIWAVLRQYFKTTKATHTHFLNEEFVEIDGVLCVGRLLLAKGLETRIQALKSQYRLSGLEQNAIVNHELGHEKSNSQVEATGQHQDFSISSTQDAQPVIPGSINNASPPTTRQPTLPGNHMFHSHATYIITGGLGGLGKSIARWMVSNGAQNLLFLSRQGGENSTAKVFLDDLKASGVTVFAP